MDLTLVLQVTNLKQRGMEFMTVPSTYYQQLREKLKSAKIKVKENIDKLEVSLVLKAYADKTMQSLAFQ